MSQESANNRKRSSRKLSPRSDGNEIAISSRSHGDLIAISLQSDLLVSSLEGMKWKRNIPSSCMMPSAAEVIVGSEVMPFWTFVPFMQLPNDHLCYINSLGYIKLLNSYICIFLECGKQAVITDHNLVEHATIDEH